MADLKSITFQIAPPAGLDDVYKPGELRNNVIGWLVSGGSVKIKGEPVETKLLPINPDAPDDVLLEVTIPANSTGQMSLDPFSLASHHLRVGFQQENEA